VLKRALPAPVESTLRALRTAVQVAGSFAALLVAVAIPPVGDAANAILELVGVDYEITPGLVLAIGLVGTALAGIVAKVQNLIEGRDDIGSTEELAEYLIDLVDQVNELEDALREAKAEALPPYVD